MQNRSVSIHNTNGKRQRVKGISDFAIAESATEAADAHSDFLTSQLDGGTLVIVNWRNISALAVNEPAAEDIAPKDESLTEEKV